MGGEHTGVDVVLLDGRTCEDPQVTSDDFEAVDLVVGQPVGARPRGLPEVEGGVEARDAGVFRTEQDLRPHLHDGGHLVGMEDVGRGPDGGRAGRRVVANDAFIGHADVDVLTDDFHREHVSRGGDGEGVAVAAGEFVPLVGSSGQARVEAVLGHHVDVA